MQVKLINAGKKFNSKWVFKNLNFAVETGLMHAITGKNGSGKSTLILMIAAYISPSQGNIQWKYKEKNIHGNELHKHISIASPYLELIEEFTMVEMIQFQKKFKPYKNHLTDDEVVKLSLMEASRHKPIRQFSSGMKQRLKLVLSILGQSELLLLDEPCSNLDAEGVQWYHELLNHYCKDRSVVIASNHRTEEYPGCSHITTLA